MNNMSSELIVKLQEELVRERERTRQLEEINKTYACLNKRISYELRFVANQLREKAEQLKGKDHE